MYNIALTRFNNITWNELTLWKDKHKMIESKQDITNNNNNNKNNNNDNDKNKDNSDNKLDYCIYNTPVKIKDSVKYNIPLFVIEMNNDENIIMGIGFIHNITFNKKYNIYKCGNYNRYSYKGEYRIDRLLFNEREIVNIDILETLLFKGCTHSKRGQGITIIPDWILKNKYIDFILFIKEMFISRNMLK